MKPLKNSKQVRAFLGLVSYHLKFIKNFPWIAKHLTTLNCYAMKFAWTLGHNIAFNTLKNTLIEAPILHYRDPSKSYIVYTDVSVNACGAQLAQEQNGQELPVAFPSHSFTDTQWKWSTTEQEVYCIYYTVMKWNYYLQGSDIIVHIDTTPAEVSEW